ncbi:PepSY-like domain-containing protein [Sphingobacterium hungaricum]|uniref:Putative beta-lactamase-inhibitor-like PepSY-like domain-containing protein n=1 Tax=Sphingobacterium hungaricum TaxID=2082723 RepID=A0A928UXK4_9SPHI|nr:PepSY-like domain-containing protein [Sphingobacterium hungaricum]MBE8714547.1 hypothetical protein [Sphingobacterium hungaricum]
MKTVSKILTAGLLVFGLNSAQAQDKIIRFEQLPANAQSFVKGNFSQQDVSYVAEERENLTKEFKVRLKNGTEIEFDAKGNWKEVDGDRTAIPAKLVPVKIQDYVKKSFPETQIVKIKKSSRLIEVEISNDLELEFNAKGDFLRIDD